MEADQLTVSQNFVHTAFANKIMGHKSYLEQKGVEQGLYLSP
jgi:hypothetical protein